MRKKWIHLVKVVGLLMAKSSDTSRRQEGKERHEKDNKNINEIQHELFIDLPDILRPESINQNRVTPIWTLHKANVIAKYIWLFTIITRHGVYIDGFAGPKNPDLQNSWAAELVVNLEPRRLRSIFLCDQDPRQVRSLQALVSSQYDLTDRTYTVLEGDFNIKIDDILQSGVIGEKVATFCLIDQYSTECHWSTVKKIAEHKSKSSRKIEIFYFFPTGWLKRALSGFGPETDTPTLWWGDESWRDYLSESGEKLLIRMAEKFRDLLGYRFVKTYSIFEKEKGEGRIMFHMIHASDHPEAENLMVRAYKNVTQAPEDIEQLVLDLSGIQY